MKNPIFQNGTCGSHDLFVRHDYVLAKTYESTVLCNCGRDADGIAARQTSVVQESYSEVGYMDDDGRFVIEETILNDRLSDEVVEKEARCSDCLEEASEFEWEHEEAEPEMVESQSEWFIRCDGCNRDLRADWIVQVCSTEVIA